MNSVCKSIFRLAAAAALVAAGPAFAGSGTVGGTVGAVNTLDDHYVSNIAIDSSVGQTDTEVSYGTINNNSVNGWRLKVVSTNKGKLILAGTSGDTGREIVYTNIKFVHTTGTLGSGLNNPEATRSVATDVIGTGFDGTTYFFTGTAFDHCNAATSATVDYGYSMKITWNLDRTLLSGVYSDTLTLTLSDGI